MQKALVILLAGLVYVIMPFDFDWLPLVGWIDDVVVAAITIYYAVETFKKRLGHRPRPRPRPRPKGEPRNVTPGKEEEPDL